MTWQPQSVPHDYGRLYMEYRPTSGWLMLLMLPAVAMFGWFSWREVGKPIPDLETAIITGGLALGLLVVLLGSFALSPRRILLYQRGLLAVRPVGQVWLTWESVISARTELIRSQGVTMRRVEVRADGWRTVAFADSSGAVYRPADPSTLPVTVEQLADAIMDMSRSARYRAAVEGYERGMVVNFHKFKLSRDGVRSGWRRRLICS